MVIPLFSFGGIATLFPPPPWLCHVRSRLQPTGCTPHTCALSWGNSHANRCAVPSHCRSDSRFSVIGAAERLSRTCWPSVDQLWRTVYSSPLPICESDSSGFCEVRTFFLSPGYEPHLSHRIFKYFLPASRLPLRSVHRVL